jgi:glycosyltransferase involved in cell wall biosynthesis
MLKFAVIICTKNRANDLDISLNSIFLQTLLPDILLIVDDSNNDATHQMIKKYSFPSKTALIIFIQ